MTTPEKLQSAKAELESVLARIARMEAIRHPSDEIVKYFHLGMVGGSGRNTAKLNSRKEAAMDRSMQAAKELVALYDQRDKLARLVQDIESGEYERRIAITADRKEKFITAKVAYWRNLKVGDAVDIGGNCPVTIVRKNSKSFTSEGGVKWTAAEIIGSEAAARL